MRCVAANDWVRSAGQRRLCGARRPAGRSPGLGPGGRQNNGGAKLAAVPICTPSLLPYDTLHACSPSHEAQVYARLRPPVLAPKPESPHIERRVRIASSQGLHALCRLAELRHPSSIQVGPAQERHHLPFDLIPAFDGVGGRAWFRRYGGCGVRGGRSRWLGFERQPISVQAGPDGRTNPPSSSIPDPAVPARPVHTATPYSVRTDAERTLRRVRPG